MTGAEPGPTGHGRVGVVLRPMRWWDIAAVHRIETNLFPDPWSVEAFWSELAHVPATRYYLVAERAGAESAVAESAVAESAGTHPADVKSVVGYAGMVVAGHQADVQTLAVAATHQRGGLGARLLDALLAEARRRGAAEVLLEVRAENTAAQALYARAGFERVAVRRGYYRPGGTDALVLRLRLAHR